MFLCMILVFDEVNDFFAASEHSNINGVNVILTGLWYCSQTVIRIIFRKLKFNFGLKTKINILFQFMCNTIFDIYAWNLSRINYVPDVASYLQLLDYLWELQQFFIMTGIFAFIGSHSLLKGWQILEQSGKITARQRESSGLKRRFWICIWHQTFSRYMSHMDSFYCLWS